MNLKGPTDEGPTLEESLLDRNKSASNLNSPDSSQLTSLSLTLPQPTTRRRLRLTRGSAKLWRNFSRKRSNSHGSVKMASGSAADELFIDGSDIILQESVQLMNCFQTQQRYLILLNSTLVVTKQRSSASFHVKDEVRLSELWLADCIDQVSEAASDHDRSFVIGWPSVNVVATFASLRVKDSWLDALQQQMRLEKSRYFPQNVVIKIVNTSQEFSVTKHMLVGNEDNAKDILSRCIQEMHILTDSVDDFQFWVQSDKENHPYPLIGHEYPFAIQMNYVREKQGVVHSIGFTESLCDGLKFQIVSKQIKLKLSMKLSLDETRRTPKKSSKIVKLFQKSSRSVEIGTIFGHDLNDLFHDNMLCPSIMDILTHLFLFGPSTVDIFRKSTIVSKCQEAKQQLDHGDKINFDDLHVFVSAALLKELLRCLPNCLLLSEFYSKWIKISAVLKGRPTAVSRMKSLVDLLPLSHQTFLRHLMCILHRISQNSKQNGMTSYSLSVCISQTLLWQRSVSGVGLNQVNDAKKLNAVVERMIDSAGEIFGDGCLNLFDHLEPRWNRDREIDRELSARENSSLDIVHEESRLVNHEFDFTPSNCSDVLCADTSPATDSYDSGLAASGAVSYSDLAAQTAVAHLPIVHSGQKDVGQSFSAVHGDPILGVSGRQTRRNIGNVSDWFRMTFQDSSHFLFDETTEFGVLGDINSNLPDSFIQQKILADKILSTSSNDNSCMNTVDESVLNKSNSSPSVNGAAESLPVKMIEYDRLVAEDQDQSKLCRIGSNSCNITERISLEFPSDRTLVDQDNSSSLDKNISVTCYETIRDLPETTRSVFGIKKYLKGSLGADEPGEIICKSPENERSGEPHMNNSTAKLTSKSNLLRLRRGMTEGGGDIFPKQFVGRFHCAFADSAVPSEGHFKVKDPRIESDFPMEKTKSSASCSQSLFSTVLKPTYVQSWQQGVSKSPPPLRPEPFQHRQQGAVIRNSLRPSRSAPPPPRPQQQPSSWLYVASLRCFSNGQRLRPNRPPSYEEAMAEKTHRNISSSGSPPNLQSPVLLPRAALAGNAANDVGPSGRNTCVLFDRAGNADPSHPSADDRMNDIDHVGNPAITVVSSAAVDVNLKLENPVLETINDVTENARNLALHSGTDDSIPSKFNRRFAGKVERHSTAEPSNWVTKRTLPDYYSRPNALNANNHCLNAGSPQTENLQSNISNGSVQNFSHRSFDKRQSEIPVLLSSADLGDLNNSFLNEQGLGRGVRKRRQRQHYSDPKLRTCRPICLGLGRSKSDSCEIIGRKCEGCVRREDKENFVCQNSLLKRKLAAMKQLTNASDPNRFHLNRTRNPLSFDLSMVKEDSSPNNKSNVESLYSPKDLKKKRSVALTCHDDGRFFPPGSHPENQSDKDISEILNNIPFTCTKKSECCSKNSHLSDSLMLGDDHDSQVLQSMSSGGVCSTPEDRLLYVFRSAKSVSPDDMKVDWSVTKLKQTYNDDNGSECCSVAKSLRMVPLHDSPYFV